MADVRTFPIPANRAPARAVASPAGMPGADADSAPLARVRPAPDALVPTVFHERWWLDVVTRGNFKAAELHHKGRLIGWLPYSLSRRHGLRVSVMPPLTHSQGPAIDEGQGSSNTRWLRRLDTVQELIGQLPALALFSQTCHPGTPDILGFQARGFDSCVQFSGEIAPAPEDLLWRGMRDKTRNVIRRAQERSQVEALADPQEFTRFYAANLAAAGDSSYFDLELIAPLFDAAWQRDQCHILGVRNQQGVLIAAAFFVWDQRRTWYLLSSRCASHADNGAMSLLIWEGMRESARRGLIFDFDGVASAGAARFFAGFGAEIRPRFAVHRRSTSYEMVQAIAAWLRGRSNRNHFTAP